MIGISDSSKKDSGDAFLPPCGILVFMGLLFAVGLVLVAWRVAAH